MSNKKQHKKKTVTLAKEQSGRTPKRSDWDQLAESPSLLSAYREFAVSLQRSQALAEQRAVRSSSGATASEFLDYSHALAILDQHPELIRYVHAVRSEEHRESLRRSTMIQREAPTGSYPQAGSGGWSFMKNQPQGVINAMTLRYYADNNVWCRSAINERRTQIGTAEIAVMPLDPKKRYDKRLQHDLQLTLEQPNERRQNWSELISSVHEDLLVLGRGAISKGMTLDRKPTALYQEDAATIKIYPNWDGSPDMPRYLYEEPGTSKKVPLRNDEIIMPFLNPATYRYGLSPVQVLMDTIKADMEATKQALRMMEQKPPPHAFQIKNASSTQLEAMRDAYMKDVMGQRELFWFGGPEPAQHFPLVFSARDNQFLEYQEYMVRKICAIFQISAQQLQMTMQINRATAEVQAGHSEDVGLIPLLLLWEEYLNGEFIADYAPLLPYGRYDLLALNLCARFPMISEQARQLHARESLEMASQGLAGLPSFTLNQILSARGEEPVKGGDTYFTTSTVMPWLSYDGELGDFIKDPNDVPEQPLPSPADQGNGNGNDIPANDDNSGDSNDSNADSGKGKEQAGKAAWFDGRPPGRPWKPKYMQRGATL